MFRRLPGVLMFGLCFLSSTERVSGDGEKQPRKENYRERQREEAEGARWKLVLGDQCMCYCLFCFFVRKDEGRGEEASEAHEQCLGPLEQMPDHTLGIKVTACM